MHDPLAPSSAAAAEGASAGEETRKGSEAFVRVPRYDKSARGGRGDRAPEAEWSVVSKPPDVVLLEGWMLGFEVLPEESPLLAAAEQAEQAEQAEDGERQQRQGGPVDPTPCLECCVQLFYVNTVSRVGLRVAAQVCLFARFGHTL